MPKDNINKPQVHSKPQERRQGRFVVYPPFRCWPNDHSTRVLSSNYCTMLCAARQLQRTDYITRWFSSSVALNVANIIAQLEQEVDLFMLRWCIYNIGMLLWHILIQWSQFMLYFLKWYTGSCMYVHLTYYMQFDPDFTVMVIFLRFSFWQQSSITNALFSVVNVVSVQGLLRYEAKYKRQIFF